jgi:AAA+ superfamily predicted ATPase
MATDDDKIDFLSQFLSESDESNEPPRFGRTPTRRTRPSARDVLVALSLNKAVDADVRERLQAGKLKAIAVSVPDGGWAQPIADAIADSVEEQVHRVVREKIPAPRDLDEQRLPSWLRDGEIVVGVAQDPDRALPPLLLSVAEARIVIPAPDAALVMEAIRHCQEGDVPPEAAELKPQLLSFDELCSLIPHGGKAAETVARVRLAIERKLSSGIGRKRKAIPRLEEAVEYGEAREWALRLRDDIADLRANLATWDDVDKGAILFGPPGTGKTLLAQMLGEATGLPTVVSSVGEFFASSAGYLDSVIKAMRKVFDEAKARAPCILFLDELNALPNIDQLEGKNRDWWVPVILDFYQLLDGAMSDRAGVIVIGATNRLEDIHPALLRPGRLERAIFVGPPDEQGVERIMRHHLGGELADADLTMLATLDVARSATGAVIEEQIRAARRLARRAKRPILLEDVEAQIVSEEHRSEEDIRRTALHEAGHVVAGLVQGMGELKTVSILSNGTSGGSVSFDEYSLAYSTREHLDAMVVTLLAGRAAEQLVLDLPSQGAGGSANSDLGRATQLMTSIFTATGLGGSLVFRASFDRAHELLALDSELRRQVESGLATLHDRATELLRRRRDMLSAIADALIEKRFLTGQEVKKIVERFPIEEQASS